MPDYMYQLESRLSPEQRAGMVRIQELATAAEMNLYLTGGAVRDLITGMPIRDLDFTIEGNPSRIVRELEKGGAQILEQNEDLRSAELILSGGVETSISAAREDFYAAPGSKRETRFSTIMADLRRRDFSINAIAISLNVNSRGLLLDPTNGLADLERREVRALSIRSFSNQPVRLLRVLRYAGRMGFNLDSRTADWFKLALERELQKSISPEEAGSELRHAAREDNPTPTLKSWESHDLLEIVHPHLARRHPDYDAIQRLIRARDELLSAGFRPRLFAPMTLAVIGRLKDRERTSALTRMSLYPAELRAVQQLEPEAQKISKLLSGPKTASITDAFAFLEKTPLDIQAYLLAESNNGKVLGKIKNYLNKWTPLRAALPGIAVQLEVLGLEHGPKFDKVVEDFFHLQLAGRARKPEDYPKILRKLAGIKEPPKKIEEKKKPEKGKKKGGAAPEAPAAQAPETGKAKSAPAASPAPAAKKTAGKATAAKPASKPQAKKKAGKK